jgi:ribosomal protein L11 methyltransferase
MADEYRRFWVSSSDAVEREILLAAAFEAGALGAEENEEAGRFRVCIYANSNRIETIRAVVLAAAANSTEIEAAQSLPQVDWSDAWKQGLEALRISRRLLVRPPFIDVVLAPDQREIVIDPGQAFGTGAHASTRLCLEWIDELMKGTDAAGAFGAGGAIDVTGVFDTSGAIDRVLDVGTGSGVLALAAVALGAKSAVGLDLDPVAIEAARFAARRNGLAASVRFLVGPIEALSAGDEKYPLVLANLLKSEMLPIASALGSRVARTGRLVLAGLLEEDVAEVRARFAEEGMAEVGRRSRKDSTGLWVGLCLAFD